MNFLTSGILLLCTGINISQSSPWPFFLADKLKGERKFATSQRTINTEVFSLEVLQSGTPCEHYLTRGLLPFLSFSVFLSLFIHPSFPSHLLHHLCSCNNKDSSCATFTPLLSVVASPYTPIVKGNSILLIWTCHHADIPLSWIMEKSNVKFGAILAAYGQRNRRDTQACGWIFL